MGSAAPEGLHARLTSPMPDAAPEPAAPSSKTGPYCGSGIPVAAPRFPHCTAALPNEPVPDATHE
jgi:hypothetical protein